MNNNYNGNRDPLEEHINAVVNNVAEKISIGVTTAVNEVQRAASEINKGVNNKNYYPPKAPHVNPPQYNNPQNNNRYTPPAPNTTRYSSGKANQTDGSYHYSYVPKPQPNVTPVPAPKKPKDKKGKSIRRAVRWSTASLASIAYVLIAVSLGNPVSLPIILAMAVSGLVFGSILGKVFTRNRKAIAEKPEVPKAAEPIKNEEKKSSGNPELDKIIEDGDMYIRNLRLANDLIAHEGISNSIDRMENASIGIFNFVKDNPEKIPQIKKFMNYYLPTTLKLLKSYEKLSRQKVKGDNISSTMFDIEGMMTTIATAFEKQLDGLFGSQAMDIQADITVFESILQQEGLKDEEINELK